MRKLKTLFALLVLSFFTIGNVWATLPESPKWEAKALGSIKDGSTVIIMSSSDDALPSTTTSSSPVKIACVVSTSEGVSTITPTSGTLQALAWTLTKSSSNYKFYQEGSDAVRLYLTGTSSNTALRVGNASNSNDQFVMGDLGKLLKVTTGNRFVGPYSSGSDWRTYGTENASNYGGASLTFYVLKTSDCEEPATKLAVSASPTTIYANGTSTLSIGETGNGSTVTYSVTSNNSAYASIEGTTFSATRAGTYTVQASQDDDNGVCGGTATVDITVRYQIKWCVNGDDAYAAGSPTAYIETHEGKIGTFPTSPISSDCDGSKEFVGWTASPIDGTTDNKPTFVTPQTPITSNTTLYAVFATRTANSYSLGDINDLINGKNVIVYNANQDKAMASSIQADGKLNGLAVTFNSTNISSPDAALVWTVFNDGAKYIFKSGNNYLRVTSNSANTKLTCDGTSDTWTIAETSTAGVYTLYSTAGSSTYLLEAYTSGTTSFFTSYKGSGNNYNMKFYVPTYSAYVTTCCTPLGAITGTISLEQSGENLVASGWGATSEGNETGYLVKLYNSDKSQVISYANTGSKATKSHTYTNPGAGTYWVSVTPTATGNDGGYCEEGDETFSASSITLTGNVIVTFKLNGGSVEGGVEKTQEVEANTSTALTSLATLGYTAPSCKEFGGWAASEEDANASPAVVAYADGANINISGATNLWAIWNTKTFAVTDGTIAASVASHSYSANPIACGETLTITCAAAATHKGNPTVTATGTHGDITVVSATEVTIANVQSAIAVSIAYETAKANYAITWNVNGTDLSGAALEGVTTSVLEGNAIEALPANPAGIACAGTFMGWSKKNYNATPKTASDYDDLFKTAASAPAISEATTFYAVFATALAGTAHYAKVTATKDITDGHYLIVYEGDADHDSVAFDGSLTDLDVAENGIVVTIDDGSIVATNTLSASEFIISGSALTSASGYQIGKTAYSNGLDASDTKSYTNTFSIDEGGNAVITASGGCTLCYNYASDQLRFRYYKSGQKPIQLYKYNDGTTYSNYVTECPTYAVSITTPTVGTGTLAVQKQVNSEWVNISNNEEFVLGTTLKVVATPEENYYLGTLSVTYNDGEAQSITPDGDGKFDMPAYAVTVSATFAQKYVVTYNANGGNCATASATYEGTALVLPEANHATLYFAGWYDKAENGNKIGNAGNEYTPTATITLYAHWSETEPTGFDNIESDVKAVKVLRDGQIFILRGEKVYTIQGQLVK